MKSTNIDDSPVIHRCQRALDFADLSNFYSDSESVVFFAYDGGE